MRSSRSAPAAIRRPFVRSAALRLTFLGAKELSPSCIEGMREQLAQEEKDCLALFAGTLKTLS